MPPRKLKVETPGEPEAAASDQAASDQPETSGPASQDSPAAGQAAQGAALTNASEAAPAPTAPVASGLAGQPNEAQVKENLLREQLEATAGLVGSNQALDWAHLTQPGNMQQAVKPDPDLKLPDANSIDPATIPFRQSVLTRQGWLLSTATDPNDRRRY